MAERRMLSKKIVESDSFLDMPLSAQALYMHLNMAADDDGFVNAPKRVQRSCGASEEDLNLLQQKKFILTFESGVICLKHWLINNRLRKDRYRSTEYVDEASLLGIKGNGAYTLDGNQMTTKWQPSDNQRLPQDSIVKDSIVYNARARARNTYFNFPQREYTEEDLNRMRKRHEQ